LIRALAAGDRTAYTRLYGAHLDSLQQYIFLFTGDKETAEEIVQDVFVKIWEKRTRLGEVDSFPAYLFRAAKNHLLNHLRREQVRSRAFGHLQQRTESAPNGQDPLHQFDYRQTHALVRKAIGRLPRRRRQIFLLSTEEGLSLDEIAGHLGISKNVVKKQLYEGYDFVRTYLIEHGELPVYVLLIACLLHA
jgi:RNA polymerase sigma-70 factor (family 1)